MDEFTLPGPNAPARLWAPRAWSIVRAGLWLALFGLLRGFVPRFEAIFRDFGVGLPMLSRATIALAHAANRFGVLFLAALAALILYDLEVLAPRLANPYHRRQDETLAKALTVLPLVVMGVVIVSMLLPLTALVAKLSG
jgi:type II secretory pathway component PulF